MLNVILIGALLMAVTVLVHAAGTIPWINFLAARRTRGDPDSRRENLAAALVSTAVVLLLLHVVEVTIWAVSYMLILPEGQLADFEEALYFSLITFTTVGYGDITLETDQRLLSGIEGLNGILLVGWSTAMLFAVLQRYWTTGRTGDSA